MLTSLLHLFYPHTCAGCGNNRLQPQQVICAGCMARLPHTGFINHAGNPVEKLFYGRLPLQAAGSAFYFTRPSLLQNVLIELKYHQHQQAGIWLGRLLGHQLLASERFSHIDTVVPVPLHRKKERQRGYNQAGLLAAGIAAVCQLQVVTTAVARQAFTGTQTHKGRADRLENLENAFTLVQPTALQHRHVLLVDDVLTTGATLESCGRAILQASPATLSIATVAYTLL
jgi:ComF family protein